MPQELNLSELQKRERERNQAISALHTLDNLVAKFNVEASQSVKTANALKAAAEVIRTERQRNQELQQELDALKKVADAPSEGKHAKPAKGSLIKAIARGNDLQVKPLIDQGANPNETDDSNVGRTPLMYAVMQANIQMVSLLIERGANIHAKDKAGRTALDLAKIYADPTRLYADVYAEIVKVLEDAAKRQQPKVSEVSAKPQGKPLTVLIDGSGSMGGALSGQQSPLQRALDSTLALADAGTNVSAVLWGDFPVSVPVTKEVFEKASHSGLGVGTKFSPAVEYIKAGTQSRNFVILSDGDLSDRKEASLKIREFLSSNPEATLDFVVISDRKVTLMAELATILRGEYPRQVTLSMMTKNRDVTACLTSIAAFRGVNQPKRPTRINSDPHHRDKFRPS